MQDFEGDEPVVLEIAGQEDGRHPATTELPLDRVAVLEGSNESRGRKRHGGDHESVCPESAPVGVRSPASTAGDELLEARITLERRERGVNLDDAPAYFLRS